MPDPSRGFPIRARPAFVAANPKDARARALHLAALRPLRRAGVGRGESLLLDVAMSFGPFRAHCAKLPGATRDVKWGADEVYSVGGKMFAVFGVEDGRPRTMAFKCDPGRFLELTDLPGIVPAPYLARAHWVQVKDAKALPRAELTRLIADSHALVFAGLTRKAQAAILAAVASGARNLQVTRKTSR